MVVCFWRCFLYTAAQALCNLTSQMVYVIIFWSCPPPSPIQPAHALPSVIYPCDHSQLFIGWHHKGIGPIIAVPSYKHKQSSILMIQNWVFLSVRSEWEILHWVALLCLSSFVSCSQKQRGSSPFERTTLALGPSAFACIISLLPYWHCDQLTVFMVQSSSINMQFQHWHTGHGCDT